MLTDTDTEKLDIIRHGTTNTGSSSCPELGQIPYHALERLAGRYELGAKKYGQDNWRGGLTDKNYVIHRLEHCIRHAYSLINKLRNGVDNNSVDDDAAAIMWAGAFACEATTEQGTMKNGG